MRGAVAIPGAFGLSAKMEGRAVRFWAWAVREGGLRGRRIMAARAPLTAPTAPCWSRHGAVRRPARRPGSDPRPAPPAGSPLPARPPAALRRAGRPGGRHLLPRHPGLHRRAPRAPERHLRLPPRAPAVNTFRSLFQALEPADLEAAFRRHARALGETAPASGPEPRVIALDGKTLKRSFDHLNDKAAAHVLSAFAGEAALILAHQEVGAVPEEIPAAQALIGDLGLRGVLFTADALHCQKNLRERRPHRQRLPGPAEGQPARLA